MDCYGKAGTWLRNIEPRPAHLPAWMPYFSLKSRILSKQASVAVEGLLDTGRDA
jgi:hypothetical protein